VNYRAVYIVLDADEGENERANHARDELLEIGYDVAISPLRLDFRLDKPFSEMSEPNRARLFSIFDVITCLQSSHSGKSKQQQETHNQCHEKQTQ